MPKTAAVHWLRQFGSPRTGAQVLAACAGLASVTCFGVLLHLDLTSVSFLYLLVVIAAALYGGFWQASIVSALAALCLTFFFIPPAFSFSMQDPRDWVALGAFQVTAVVISRLSAKELRSKREAEVHRVAMERLYELSRNSLLMDMREPPGPQLVVLIERILNVEAVALFDLNLGRQDRAGDWREEEEDIAKASFLEEAEENAEGGPTWRRTLTVGSRPVGSLVLRGDLTATVVDALASLAAIAIERHQSCEKEERAETASKTEQLRAAVMDALAHDLKTPLTAVQTASSGLLELGRLTSAQRDLASLINEQAIELNRLCTRLLLTAKLEASRFGLHAEDVNIAELIAEVLTRQNDPSVRERCRIRNEDEALTVSADKALLSMIVAQYLDNAQKYSTAGSRIDVEVVRSHSEMVLSVHNVGSTIRIEDRERVFDRFYRTSDLKDSVPGTGIGLSVVKKAAQAHSGHVWVISDEASGTTFFLSIPIAARRTLR